MFFYSVSEALSSACSSADTHESGASFFSTDTTISSSNKRFGGQTATSVHQDLISLNNNNKLNNNRKMLTSTPPIIQLQVTSNGHEWKEEEENSTTFMSSPQINGNLQQQQNGGGKHSSSFCHSPIFGISVGALFGGQIMPFNNNNNNKEANMLNGTDKRHIFARQKSEEADRKRRMTMPLVYRMYESQREDLCGTIRGPDDDYFHPEEASKQLREALSTGIQSHDQTIINVLLAHNNFQRQKIATTYENMFCRKLCDDIDEEAGGHFADSVIALLTPAHIYTTKTLYYAISGKSFSRCVAVEIGLTGTTQQLKVICDTYQTEFRTSLERDLTMKIEGLFGKILLQLLVRKDEPNNKSSDNEGEEEEETAIREADKLFVGGIEELGRSFDLFNRIFGLRSASQIRAFVQHYDRRAIAAATTTSPTTTNISTKTNDTMLSGSSGGGGGGGPFHAKSRERSQERRGRDFETSIRKCVNIHSDVKQAILLYVRIAKNMQLYFAERLHEAISQNRPDHSSIIRILVSRSEIDLYDICNEYKRRYGHPLVYDLQQMCSGDFFRLLSQLVNPSELASGDSEVF
ncbi:unnamed protein product [Meloidogyne enterolobii]|uniref:Uncharacterized protein n=1 Tax=Meloidogyne enterolobii TaxID=390850 RepID=A0ACB0XZC1_MELEN